MISLKSLMAAGDALFSGVVIPGDPDWRSLHDSTPDDTMPGESDESDPSDKSDPSDESLKLKLKSILTEKDDALFAKNLRALLDTP